VLTTLSHKINYIYQHTSLAPYVDIREIHWHFQASTDG